MKYYSQTGELYYGSEAAAGVDLTARTFDVKKFMFGTGVRVEIPDGCYGLVVPRSSTGSKLGFKLRNTVGIIDADYRGEIFLAVEPGALKQDAVKYLGLRVAQLIIQPYYRADLQRVSPEEFTITSRGDGGFGSTGA